MKILVLKTFLAEPAQLDEIATIFTPKGDNR
jgi:hypothetical protein